MLSTITLILVWGLAVIALSATAFAIAVLLNNAMNKIKLGTDHTDE